MKGGKKKMKRQFDKPSPERLKEFKDAINAET